MDFQLHLNREKVTQAHTLQPRCVEPTTTVREVFRLLKEELSGGVLICRDGVLEGIFTERDALKLMAHGADLDVPVEQVMIRKPVTLNSDDTVGRAIAKMSFGGYRRLPIVDAEGHPVGMLKVSGILHYLVEHFPNVVYTLPPKPHHQTQEREGA